MMTVHNKIYEALAMRLCVVTGDSPAVRGAFGHEKELWLCERANPGSLASAVKTLRSDPALRSYLAEQGHRAYLAQYTAGALGAQLRRHLQELVKGDRP
jgi:glycosyltransferase involved in cell wall biosynthesis